jgi:uncharacterized membrane protein
VPDVVKRSDERAADRLIFFSDAVVAIAITLLALDLPVPEQTTWKYFWHAVHVTNSDAYLAFGISFVVIAAAWSHHHSVFRYVERVDARLRRLNMVWLLMIILNPFATRLLTTPGHDDLVVHAVKFGFYAVLQGLAAALVLAMIHHMISAGLLEPGSPPLTDGDWVSYGMIAGYGLSIPVFFLTTRGWLTWAIVPFLVSRIKDFRDWGRRKAGPPAGSGAAAEAVAETNAEAG